MMEDTQYQSRVGRLITPDAKLHRQYFEEAVRLIGIQVFYRAPLPNKHYTNYTEIESNYYEPIQVGCLFHNHPTQKTLKKLGWVSELSEDSVLIEVPYDLPNLQQGALFFIPSGIDNASSRLFRVVTIQNKMLYPSSITCELVPEFEDTFNKEDTNYTTNDFTLLTEEEDVNQPNSEL